MMQPWVSKPYVSVGAVHEVVHSNNRRTRGTSPTREAELQEHDWNTVTIMCQSGLCIDMLHPLAISHIQAVPYGSSIVDVGVWIFKGLILSLPCWQWEGYKTPIGRIIGQPRMSVFCECLQRTVCSSLTVCRGCLSCMHTSRRILNCNMYTLVWIMLSVELFTL